MTNQQLLDKDLQLKQLQLENESLKETIEQMSNEMTNVLLEVKELKREAEFSKNNGLASDANMRMQQEIMSKERKIYDLERKLRARDEEVERLKEERERLIHISNELRGELTVAQRRLVE